jgi:hypothetical protein
MARVTGSHESLSKHEVPGADRTLTTACIHLDTGNLCLVTPAVTRLGPEVRMAFAMYWMRKPTTDEQRAIQSFIECGMCLGAPVEVLGPETATHEQLMAMTGHFLSGKKAQ